MTREEAIKVLEEDHKQRVDGYTSYLAHYGHQDQNEELHLDAMDMAIAALREQEERSKVVTQANRIRAMTDEELAKWLSICGCPDAFSMVGDCESGRCEECWSAWLQQPYISEDIKSSEYIEKDIEGDA